MRWKIIAAFAAIYLIWGSTYLAIRFAIETMPPLLMAGIRFLIAGGILYAWQKPKSPVPLTDKQFARAAITGLLLVSICNGGVSWAEQRVASGLTALLVATTPAWIALLEWLRPNGLRPSRVALLGVSIGFAGVFMLVNPQIGGATRAEDYIGMGVLMVVGLSAATGALYVRNTPKHPAPLLPVAVQMIIGGAVLVLAGLIRGEAPLLQFSRTSTHSLLAFAYLIFMGSIVAYSSFNWLLGAAQPSKVATYAYVNPAIAVLLGTTIGNEPMTPGLLMAAAVIICGVILITLRPGSTDSKDKS